MKKISYLIIFFVLAALNYSCLDQSTIANPSLYELENGAYVRFVTAPPTSFVPEVAQSVSINADLYDANGNVAQYDLSVTANIVSTGETFIAENFITITSFPATLNITAQMIADAINVDLSAFGAGDFIQFTGVATRNDGVKFYGIPPTFDDSNGTIGIGNTESNLLNAIAYQDAMTFDYIVACPIDDTKYVGKYMLTHPVGTCCGGAIFLDQEVELELVSVYQRSFPAIYLEQFAIGNGPIDFTINFICGEVTAADNQNSGLQCANGILFNGSDAPGGYDEVDDSVLVVKFQEACQDCGCAPDEETEIILTKV
ncbi:hypothetical protein N1F78_03495 [Seonamhaeicola sp. MEBiC1930]|uniref:hypothetical protein n=1 Tax=Seonamhaeicola sp. MEBiC01930 TaxID=2976768 RepID=UPI00324DC266